MKLKRDVKEFNRQLADAKAMAQYNTMREVGMHNSPMAFQSTEERNPIMMGWEWERVLKQDNQSRELREKMLNKLFNSPLRLYVNARNEGNDLELVSIPATLSQHKKWMETFLFKKEYFIDKIVGRVSSNRGIHIHIDKSAFSDASLDKFICFISDKANKQFMKQIAGRDIYRNRWCKPYNIKFIKDKDDKITHSNLEIEGKTITGQYCEEKEVAVNTDSLFNTVELRIFKTTSKKNIMYRNLEFADALTRFSNVHPFEDLNVESFMAYVVRNKVRYPNLSQFKMKGI